MALLWSGVLSPVLAAMPCSPSTMAMASDDEVASDAAVDTLPDCCLDAETAAVTGQTCKPGTACAPLLAGAPVADAGLVPSPAPAQAQTNSPDRAARAAPPGAVWRPPALRG